MKKNLFQNKIITVFGLGLHGGGVGTVKFLVAQKPKKIIVTDLKTKQQLKPSLQKLQKYKNIEYVLGQHRQEDFIYTDLIIKTPVISWKNEYIKLALKKGINVETDSSLFFQLCQNPIIGITGSKGKTTTASMIVDILKASDFSVVSVGIGQTSVLDKLLKISQDDWVVFELSSWRLSALEKIKKSPQIAVITNIFPDHLNYYSTLKKYIKDKKNIFIHQLLDNWVVYNYDNLEIKKMIQEANSQLLAFSFKKKPPAKSIFQKDNCFYLNDGIDEKEIIKINEMPFKMKHNQSNLLAAIGATYIAGTPIEKIKKAIKNIKPIPHRLELVAEINGVKYYNDTAATIPEATQVALKSFTEDIILIVGGTDKKLNYQDLARDIATKVKEVVFFKGSATDKLIFELKKILRDENKKFEVVNSVNKAVEIASRIARKGDAVLLSPGAASFGLFDNEFDRGNKFKEAVLQLKNRKLV